MSISIQDVKIMISRKENLSVMKLTDISTIRSLLGEEQTDFKKKFGQNFLVNEGVVKKIVAGSGASGDCGILEIGPGIGVMTVELADVAKKVVSLEIDPDMVAILGKTLEGKDNVRVICQDVLKTDLPAIIEENFSDCAEIRVCANLPYYITTPIITMLLESGLPLDSVTVMVQKEVADRLVAKAGSDEYGAISAFVAYYGKPYKIAAVSAGSFIPAPKVDSSVVRIDIFKEKEVKPKDEKLFFEVVRAAFMQRRKTLVNAVVSALGGKISGLNKEKLTEIIVSLGFSPTVRGETLDVFQFDKVADEIHKLRVSP